MIETPNDTQAEQPVPVEDECRNDALIDEILRDLEDKHRIFFDSTRDMRFMTSRDGRLLDVNQAGVLLFGYDSKEEMLDLHSVAELLWNPEDAARIQKKIEEDGFVKDFEVEMKGRGDRRITASITANLLLGEDGSILCEGHVQDITERRQWQKALIESVKQNRQLSESEKRIRKLNEHILHMLMVVSHDIRGPLVAMGATLKLLIRGTYGKMDESVHNTLKDLLSRVRQLTGIAEDCLGKAYSVDGSLKVIREVLDLRQDIIDPVLDELSNDIDQLQITIDNRLGAIPAGSILVNVNKIWLKVVFRNLFRNAIKYGGRGCRIAFGFEDHGTYYRLNVYNSGNPIPEEYRQRLFTKFGRIETGERRHS